MKKFKTLKKLYPHGTLLVEDKKTKELKVNPKLVDKEEDDGHIYPEGPLFIRDKKTHQMIPNPKFVKEREL